MAVSNNFDNILEQIKMSNLNFWVQLSPNSATMLFKKSSVRDVSGNPMMPPIPKPVIKGDTDSQARKIRDMILTGPYKYL